MWLYECSFRSNSKPLSCVQLGDLNGITNWAEVVVTHDLGEAYKWYTYDSDEGGGSMTYYMDKNTPSTATDTFVMMLDGTQDSNVGNTMSG